MKTLGILGGMGPLATIDLYEKIVRHTDAHKDKDHIHVLIDSYPDIPDRTAFITGDGENPLPFLIEAAQKIEAMGAEFLVMPCNTAHYFYEEIARFVEIPFLHMIDEVGVYIQNKKPKIKKVGILATEGTYKGQIYEKRFAAFDLEILTPNEADRKIISELIYNIKEGHASLDKAGITRALAHMDEAGAEVVVLGCTELPIAFRRLNINNGIIDPTLVLAMAAVEYAGARSI